MHVQKHFGKQGILLVNLGTPDAPTPKAVNRYLGEFLTDPRVIDNLPYPPSSCSYAVLLLLSVPAS